MKLTVIIPVYNEARTLSELMRRVREVPLEKEIIVVDDGSNQETKSLLKEAVEDGLSELITHPENQGKGAAVCTGLKRASGDLVVIQDADLEYFPSDYLTMLDTYERKSARAVYGVRDLSHRTVTMRAGNRLMTATANVLFGTRLHDMETCYKLIDRNLLQSLDLQSRGFEIEAEITAKLARAGIEIHEVPIHYEPRDVGKKLTPWDAIPTLRMLAACYWQWR